MSERYEGREEEQRSTSRRVWIVIGILVLLGICAAALVGSAAIGMLVMRSGVEIQGEGWMDSGETRIERTFQVKGEPQLEVVSCAGRIEVVVGDADQIRVKATKRSSRNRSTDNVKVEMSQSGNTVRIEAQRRGGFADTSVDIEVVVPQNTALDLHTNAGSLSVKGLRADQELQTNAGSIELHDCQGTVNATTNAGSIKAKRMIGEVRLETNAGSVDYEGDPQGSCRFDSSAGGIYLELPADLDAEIDLESGAGSVTVDWPVKGSVEKNHVRGTIGDGDEVEIRARTGAGRIRLIRK